MKRVLILTASTGEGHNAAARSLAEKYGECGYETHTFDFLKDTSAVMNTLVADGYRVLAQSFPSLYGRLYEQSDRKYFNQFSVAGQLTIRRRVIREIKRIDPAMIIGTHPFAVSLISNLKARGHVTCKFVSVVTDFKAHYAYIAPHVDAYITGSEFTKESLVKRNVPEERIYTYGIPVKREFWSMPDPQYLEEGNGGRLRLLVMGGSMGSRDIAHVVEALVVHSDDYELDVVCGRNQPLYDGLMEVYGPSVEAGKMRIFGFTREVPTLMDRADLIITKPGGLTTTEALSKRIPMIIPFAIPGQEQENAAFLEKSGAAIVIENLDELVDRMETIRKNPQLYNQMVDNMARISGQYSIDKIVELTESLAMQCSVGV